MKTHERGEQSEREPRGTVFIFISGEVVSCAFSLLAFGLVHEERIAHVLRLPLLIGHRHLFTVVGRPCSPGALAASRRRRLGALLNTVRRWQQALTGCNEVGSAHET